MSSNSHSKTRHSSGWAGWAQSLAALGRRLEWINEALGRVVAWLALAMVSVTFLVVVLRYVFDLGWIALQESITYMHAILFMLGIGYALRHDGHVRVDIFYQRLSARGKAWIDLLGTLFLLFPVCGLIAWIGWDYVAASWAVSEGSREAGGLPGVYLLKTLILVMPALVILQGLAILLRTGLLLARAAGDEGHATPTSRSAPGQDPRHDQDG